MLSPTAGWNMAAAKLILLSCLVAVFGYFTYKELQHNTLSSTKKIHMPAKRSDVFQKMFDDPEFYLKIHPLWYVSVRGRCMTFANCSPQTADCRPQIADCKLKETKNLPNKGDTIKI